MMVNLKQNTPYRVQSDRLWTITVVAALSSLLILAYFTLSPMLSKDSTAQKIEGGIGESIAKFDSIREDQSDSSVLPGT
jgi:hypothetical protein